MFYVFIQRCIAPPALAEAKRKFVSANHILDYHGIVDAFGHASIRVPEDQSTFIMAKGIAPALVSNDSDLAHYYISDASPVRPQDFGRNYTERFIHMLLYAMSDVRLFPTYHMVGYLGDDVPLWDITPLYTSTDIQDNLVSQPRFGADLAEAFGGNGTFPINVFVLMKQHGFTTCAATIEEAVFQAVYAKEAALAELGQIELQRAYQDTGIRSGAMIRPLSTKQINGAKSFPARFQSRPWELWTRQVEANPLYINNM